MMNIFRHVCTYAQNIIIKYIALHVDSMPILNETYLFIFFSLFYCSSIIVQQPRMVLELSMW